MYDMYPDYEAQTAERGTGGLGHYDYPVYRSNSDAMTVPESVSRPQRPNVTTERALGYVMVNEMVTD